MKLFNKGDVVSFNNREDFSVCIVADSELAVFSTTNIIGSGKNEHLEYILYEPMFCIPQTFAGKEDFKYLGRFDTVSDTKFERLD